jgi:hypothetical protein
MSNYEKLKEAKLIRSRDRFTEEQLEAIEALTAAEIKALISTEKKLRSAFGGRSTRTLGTIMSPPRPPR